MVEMYYCALVRYPTALQHLGTIHIPVQRRSSSGIATNISNDKSECPGGRPTMITHLNSVIAQPDAVQHDADDGKNGGKDYGHGHAKLPSRVRAKLSFLPRDHYRQ